MAYPVERDEHLDDHQRHRAWLLGLYVANADNTAWTGAPAGTTQNDIVKEYLSRGTYIFPPAPSLR